MMIWRVRFYDREGRNDITMIECPDQATLFTTRNMVRAMRPDYVVVCERYGRKDRVWKTGLIGWHMLTSNELRFAQRQVEKL